MRQTTVIVTGIGVSAPIPIDRYLAPTNITLSVVVSATATYTVQYTLDDVFSPTFNPATANWFSHATLITQVASAVGVVTSPVSAFRLNVAASTGTVTMVLDQAGLITGNVVSSAASTNTGLFNFKASNLTRWQTAIGKVQAGVQNAKLLCCGNSITSGLGSTNNGMLSNAASKSWPTQLAQQLTAQGLNSSWQSWIGGNGEVDFVGHDSRITLGSWVNSGLGTFGSNCMTRSAVGGTPMSFTPLTAVDTVQVMLVRAGGGVNVEISNDANPPAGVVTATSGSGVLNISTPITLTGVAGTKVIKATLQAGSNGAFMDAMIAYNSAIKEVSVLRAGWVGATVDALHGSWDYNSGITVVAPDLTIIAFTRNEITSNMNGLGIGAFVNLYRLPLINALISGDVILMIEPLGTVLPTLAAPYISLIYGLAATFDLPVIDFTRLWAPYAQTTSRYVDGTHPTGFGYADVARQIVNALLL